MAESKSVDISALLALDTTDPASALAFRRGVAELAGWTEIEKREVYYEDYEGGGWLDELVGYARPKVPGDFQSDHVIEHYETSVDAALTLPLDDWHGYEITVMDNGRSYARVRDFHNYAEGDKTEFQEGRPTALVICRAWLRYKQTQPKRKESDRV